MKVFLIVPHYISWHYTRGSKNLLIRYRDFIQFIWTFFSIGLLARTFFAPFERLAASKARGFDPQKMLEAFVTSLIMRLLGMVVRGFFITLGLASLGAFVVLGAIFFVVWIALPFLLVAMFVGGLIGLFKI
jgi:hypothetical protein